MPRIKKVSKQPTSNYLDKIEQEVQLNQSKLSLVLGVLIIVVTGILLFNYFNKNKADLGPSQQVEGDGQVDVSTDNLPGRYTVKEGDTLFTIAEKYYRDGYKYTEIAKVNNLYDVNTVTVGQVLEIPKLETLVLSPTTEEPTPSVSTITIPAESISPSPTETSQQIDSKTSFEDVNFGPKIMTNIYTVQEGDWLSTIAARAYGDVMVYQKIAQANNIPNPDHIEPGMVLTIPR